MPQWNCACPNCQAARAGAIPKRTQSGVAVSADAHRWFLINASPDLRAQIESFPPLQPRTARETPIESVFITNADLDHVLGLFLLREAGEITIHSTAAVRETLSVGARLDSVLGAFGRIHWRDVDWEFKPVRDRRGETTGLSFRAIPLPGGPPPYAFGAGSKTGHSVAFQISDDTSGRCLLIAPDVGEITVALRDAVRESDAVLLDGTFWCEEELRAIRSGARASSEMGHVPISGNGGTLELMRGAPAELKGYMHINNTNPVLAPGSPERAAVQHAGVAIPDDGWEFEL